MQNSSTCSRNSSISSLKISSFYGQITHSFKPSFIFFSDKHMVSRKCQVSASLLNAEAECWGTFESESWILYTVPFLQKGRFSKAFYSCDCLVLFMSKEEESSQLKLTELFMPVGSILLCWVCAHKGTCS